MAGTIAVTGATGLLGRALCRALAARGDRVIALVRSPGGPLEGAAEQRGWSATTAEAPLQNCTAVVHLAGVPVADGRWSSRRKAEILSSRVEGTRSVAAGMRRHGVETLVCASGIDATGDTGDDVVTDATPLPQGDAGFLAAVCARWEEEAQRAPGRSVQLRTGLVLAKEGGALAKMLPAFKLGGGGPLGSGRQWVPWIHLDDVVGLTLFSLDTPALEGPLVVAAPAPVRQRDFAQALGRAVHRPAVLPAPAFALRLALGELSTALLASHRAEPAKALRHGYRFRHATLDGALRDLLP